jgi:hypothetical protein
MLIFLPCSSFLQWRARCCTLDFIKAREFLEYGLPFSGGGGGILLHLCSHILSLVGTSLVKVSFTVFKCVHAEPLTLSVIFLPFFLWRWGQRIEISRASKLFSLLNSNNYNIVVWAVICKIFSAILQCVSLIQDMRASQQHNTPFVTVADTQPQTSIDSQNNLEDTWYKYRIYVTAMFDADWWTRENSGHFVYKFNTARKRSCKHILRPRKEVPWMLRDVFARLFPLPAYSCHPPAPFDVVSVPRALAASKGCYHQHSCKRNGYTHGSTGKYAGRNLFPWVRYSLIWIIRDKIFAT